MLRFFSAAQEETVGQRHLIGQLRREAGHDRSMIAAARPWCVGFPNHVCPLREDQDHVVSICEAGGDCRRDCVQSPNDVSGCVRQRRASRSARVLCRECRLLPGSSGLLRERGARAPGRRSSRSEHGGSPDANGHCSAHLLPQERVLLPGASAVLPAGRQRNSEAFGGRGSTSGQSDRSGRQADVLCQAGLLLCGEAAMLPIGASPVDAGSRQRAGWSEMLRRLEWGQPSHSPLATLSRRGRRHSADELPFVLGDSLGD